MFFNLEDLYIGKIYAFNYLEPTQIGDDYAIFYKTHDEEKGDIYMLLNRGKRNRLNSHFHYGTIFQEINDIDILTEDDLSFYYVKMIEPLSRKIGIDEVKPILNLLDIAFLIRKINKKERAKIKKLGKLNR